MPISTPDGRYIVVRGRLWRATRPDLSPARRQTLVNALMDGRRAVRRALDSGKGLKAARAQVNQAKIALGERGPVWWPDAAPDLNRHKIIGTAYAGWFATLPATTR